MKLKFLPILMLILCGQLYGNEIKPSDVTKKTLVIPMLSISPGFQKYVLKKGKTKDLEKVKAEMEKYNSAWKEGISQSMYNVTPYEFSTALNMDELKANKENYLYLYFSLIKKRETLMVVENGGSVLASLNIVGFNLKNKDDVRRAMNMLNSLIVRHNKTISTRSSKTLQTTYDANKNKELHTKLKEKTFYFAKFTKEDTRHYNKWNNKIESSLKKNWKVCHYKVVSKDELNDIVVNGTDPKGFYMISQKKKPRNGLLFSVGLLYTYGLAPIVYFACPHVTHTILSTADEDIKYKFKSYSRYKSGKVMKLQKKLQKSVASK